MSSIDRKTGVDLRQSEWTRYSRHILLAEVGVEGQQKLKSFRILIVGAGGLGCPAAQYLAAAGIGRIGLVDSDRVELSNLQRQILFTTDDIGLPKVEIAARRLRAINPEIDIEALHLRLDRHNAEKLVCDYDLVIDACDNFATRTILNQACIAQHKPLVYGSIHKFEGQVSIFVASDGPCYRCVYPEVDEGYSVGNCSEIGVIGVLPGMIGIAQATEALKYCLGIGEPLLNRLLHYDAWTMRWSEFVIEKNPDCPDGGGLTVPNPEGPRDDSRREFDFKMTNLMPVELNRMRQEGQPHLLIDVRTPEEARICSIEGSLLIPLSELQARCVELSRQIPVVLMCKTGVRSVSGLRMLQAMGFESSLNLAGGIMAWIRDVDPTLAQY